MLLLDSWTTISMACEVMLWYNQKVFKTQVLDGWTTFRLWLSYYVLFLKFKLSFSKQKKCTWIYVHVEMVVHMFEYIC